MQIAHQHIVQKPQKQKQTIAITATFTAEPVENSLAFWMQELDIPSTIEFAPYNQVFQQLLDPSSLLSRNQQGINVVLLRFEDWQRFDDNVEEKAESLERVERSVQDLVMALKSTVAHSVTPYMLCVCPPSPRARADLDRIAFFQQMEDLMVLELSGVAGLYLISSQELANYPVEDYYDPQTDKLGHIPFTPLFFTALGTTLARRLYALKSAPHKVIVLDCDNTLWKGVVGEDGVMGIEIPSGWKALQEFMVAQQNYGMIICLCSKNNEPDVIEVFENRPEMRLKLDHIVSWRINWLPKSENLKSLAQELNLGLDSFIFIDDNPVECAEVQASCPEVLTLQLPIDGDIPKFLNHVWAFDRLKVTEEDKQRTALYKQNVERDRFAKEALTITDFLAGLALKIEISEPAPSQLPRVAQLTQRTNQFNFTTIRRSENEIQQLSQSGLECRSVEVSDRFGDYGLVGVMIFAIGTDAIKVDTFLLSCRVLGRGVEHRMFNYLAKIAEERNLALVNAPYISTKKNLPALNFLESVGADFKQSLDNGYRFCIPVEVAAALSYTPGIDQPESISDASVKANTSNGAATSQSEKSTRLNRIATELYEPDRILEIVQSQQRFTRRQLQLPLVPPRTETEKQLVSLWSELLCIETVGINDNYFELGGTSLLAVQLFAQIDRIFGKSLPLTTILEAPTIEELANRLDQSGQTTFMDSLVLLRSGGSKPPLFLLHDGDGEILLYLNLARCLQPERPVYGLQPSRQHGCPILHTRIADMVNHFIEKIRSVQPEGPYLVGGMCAGGVLAFELARQLQIQGQKVALVAIIDAADVEAPKRIGRIAGQRLGSFSKALSQNQRLKAPERVFYILNKIKEKVINLIAYEARTKIENIQNKIKMTLFRYYLDNKLRLPQFLQKIPVRTVYLFAEKEYVPQELYQGEVTLFRATEGGGSSGDEPYINIYSDPLFGWGKRVTKGVKVYDIPGGHSSILQEPNVQVMAQSIDDYINAVILEEPVSERALALETL